MLNVVDERNIETTRGDILPLTVVALDENKQKEYEFKTGDVLRFKITKAKDMKAVLLQKDFEILEPTFEKEIVIEADEMKIGSISSKAVDYWYEIELNPDTKYTRTIIGYSKEEGPALLTLLPEGGDKVDKE